MHEITDIAGVRVVTYLENNIDDIALIIRDEFQVDEQNSVDKREHKEDSFGYKSLHYVIQFSSQRASLGENKKYQGLKVEIQIRSILQHAWASIEHKLAYKNPIPEQYKRDFNRISALLETADLGFVSLEDNITKYRKAVNAEVERRAAHIELNTVSLDRFIKSNIILKEIEDSVYPRASNYGFVPISDLFGEISCLNIKTINELENHLQTNKEAVIYLANEVKEYPVAQVGFSIRYLSYVLAAERGGEELIKKLLVAANRSHVDVLSKVYMRKYQDFMQQS